MFCSRAGYLKARESGAVYAGVTTNKTTDETRYAMAQYQGVVSWLCNAKGFGSAERDGDPDVFCHYSAIRSSGFKTLKKGDPVHFDIIQSGKGFQADNITRSNVNTTFFANGRTGQANPRKAGQ